MTTGTGTVGTDFRYYFSLQLGNGSARTGAAASVTARVRNPGNTATDLPAVTEVGFGQYFIDIASAFTTIHGVGQYGVLLEVTTAPRDTFSESVTFDSVTPSSIPGLVWDELTAAHVLAGSFGLLVGTNLDAPVSGVPAATDAVLSAAHGAGSWLSAIPPSVAAIVAGVWSEPLPGAFGGGSAGFNLDATITGVPAAVDLVLSAAHGAGSWEGSPDNRVNVGWARLDAANVEVTISGVRDGSDTPLLTAAITFFNSNGTVRFTTAGPGLPDAQGVIRFTFANALAVQASYWRATVTDATGAITSTGHVPFTF